MCVIWPLWIKSDADEILIFWTQVSQYLTTYSIGSHKGRLSDLDNTKERNSNIVDLSRYDITNKLHPIWLIIAQHRYVITANYPKLMNYSC